MDLVVSVVEYSPYRWKQQQKEYLMLKWMSCIMVVKNLNEVFLTIPGLWPDVPFTLHYQFTRRILHNVERMSTGLGNELDLSSSYKIGLDKKDIT